ncbi:4Fe-4S dicluster domain-containing protein [Ferribacterium limneticum]|uniref:4Fe-4S dicluster domain-containing protein n=1 Tax=Ferribacterium limneticum TaxID=76259 RepID=UPI001CFB9593|nr:4Fe-4S dicluster domain-containing protein [Ferribacterium limneticum]UCV17836.1 (4Fe-4S)-binding protein [Ferribacterium limneticum]
MIKWNMIVDVDKCCNCNNCALAIKDEYVGNAFPGYSAPQPPSGHEWFAIDQVVRGSGSLVDVSYIPRTCNHCDDAPCIKAGEGAVTKRPDGIVIIDPVKAKGNKALVNSCPYGAISWNEAEQLPQHWPFDAHLLDGGWKEPRCVQVCPTGALRSLKVSDDEMAAIVEREQLTTIKPLLKTRPRIYYRGLERTKAAFVGGNVAIRSQDGRLDNVAGAQVEVSLPDNGTVVRVVTDHFGDFRADGFNASGKSYFVRVSHSEFGEAMYSGELHSSVNIGTVELRVG